MFVYWRLEFPVLKEFIVKTPLSKILYPHESLSLPIVPCKVTPSPSFTKIFHDTSLRYHMKYHAHKKYKFPANGYIIIFLVLF